MNLDLQEPLTEREMQILQLISNGRTLQEVAKITHLAEQTVKSYAQTLREKMNATTNIHVVAIAFRKQILR